MPQLLHRLGFGLSLNDPALSDLAQHPEDGLREINGLERNRDGWLLLIHGNPWAPGRK